MNRLIYIIFIFVFCHSKRSNGQENGNVSIHSDPRLSLLLNKTKTVDISDNSQPADNVKRNKGQKAEATKVAGGLAQPIKEAKYLYEPAEESDAAAESVNEIRKAHAEQKTVVAEVKSVPAVASKTPAESKAVLKEKPTAPPVADKGPALAAKGIEKAKPVTTEAANKLVSNAYGEYEAPEKERSGLVSGRESKSAAKDKTVSSKTTENGSPTLKVAATAKVIKDLPHEEHHAVSGSSGGAQYSGSGFRVQIYNGPNRGEALKRKAEFMRNYPGVKTYLVFASPHYRVKVGDFRKREDALGMYREANGTYSPCMIVPDMVSIRRN